MTPTFPRRAILGGAASVLAAPMIGGRCASAADRSITVGIYAGPQGDFVRDKIIPPFENDHGCKVYTTLGVTLEQIALMRATRGNPKYSVMFVDDIGVELAKRDGLIDKLPTEQIPNMQRLLKRFLMYDGYGAAFAMSAAGLGYNSATSKPLASYGDLWDARYRGRYLMAPVKSTQSIYLLIAAVSVMTGKPYVQTQHMIDQAWPKMEALKPNVLSIVDTNVAVLQLIQQQADVAGLFYSKTVNPYTIKGAPVRMCYPREGTFAGINCLTLVKNGPQRDLAIAFIDRMLDPQVQQGLAEATLVAPTISGLEFKPEVADYMPYPEAKMNAMGIFSPDWSYINPLRSKILEKYTETFGV